MTTHRREENRERLSFYLLNQSRDERLLRIERGQTMRDEERMSKLERENERVWKEESAERERREKRKQGHESLQCVQFAIDWKGREGEIR